MSAKNVYKYDEMKRREHMAVRKTAGWYLWTHQLVEVTGEDAEQFLEYLLTGKIASLKVGADRYTTMLNERGEILDDVVVMRHSQDRFWISTLFAAKLCAWMESKKGERNVAWKNVTADYHMYAVQGPRSLEMIHSVLETKIDDLKFFNFRKNSIDGEEVLINRAGFTGEKFGYEIYIAANKRAFLEEKLKTAAPLVGAEQVTEFQVMAWTLPTEAGFYYMRDLMYTNPFEVGLTRGIDWEKDFIGKEALLQIQEEGAKREMLGFVMDEADVRINGKDLGGPGNVVSFEGREIGRVSKFNYSFVRETPVGYLLVDKGVVKPGDHVTLNRHYDAVVSEKHFL